MLLNYFKRITLDMPKGKLVVQRKVLEKYSDFNKMQKPLSQLQVEETGGIGDIHGTLEVDFANKFIGGASISYGCVQEEIKFSICPELNVTRLFCEKMEMYEAIQIQGGEQFSTHTGYAHSLMYGSDHIDTNKDDQGNVVTKTVALDALIIHDSNSQFTKALMDRELVKAYIGFYEDSSIENPSNKVSTGNWGW
jgi:poly(ADP-ribose) glycohydrolase